MTSRALDVFFHAIIVIDVRKKAKIVRNCGRGFPENNKYTNTGLEGSTVNTFIQMCVFFCQTASFSKGQKIGGGKLRHEWNISPTIASCSFCTSYKGMLAVLRMYWTQEKKRHNRWRGLIMAAHLLHSSFTHHAIAPQKMQKEVKVRIGSLLQSWFWTQICKRKIFSGRFEAFSYVFD